MTDIKDLYSPAPLRKYRVSDMPYEVGRVGFGTARTVEQLSMDSFHSIFEGAFLGIGTQRGAEVNVYNYDKCLDLLVYRDGMSMDSAMKYMEGVISSDTPPSGSSVFIKKFAHWDGIR